MSKKWWVSWYATKSTGAFELNTPWWISGGRIKMDGSSDSTICAAVIADSEEAAKEIILAAHDVRPTKIEWRFCDECPPDWSPFNERFEKAEWMQWP